MSIKHANPVEIMFVDRMLRGEPGEKGDTGATGGGGEDVATHESMYDHGDLHEHSNKGVLDQLSVISGHLAYNGATWVDSVTQSQAFQDVEATVAQAVTDVASTAANHYLFTTDYSFVVWLEQIRPDDFARFSSMWVSAPAPSQGG